MQKLVFVNANGEELELTKDPFGITDWQGFSDVELNLQTQQVPFQDGSVFLDGLLGDRTLNITLAIKDNNNLAKRYEYRRNIISVLNPKLGEGHLIYTNNYISKQIKVVPRMPIFQNHNSNDSGTPKASLTWVACNPYWEDLEDTVVYIDVQKIEKVENNGDVPAQVEIELLTNNAENPTLFNMSTDKKIELDGEIDQNVLINTNVGEKEIISENIKYDNISIYGGTNNDIRFIKKLSLFIASSSSTILRYSYDGSNWEYINVGFPVLHFDYAENISKFVITSDEGKVYLSSDLKTFTMVSPLPYYPTTYTAFSTCVYYCKETEKIFLLYMTEAGGYIYSSEDGETWVRSAVNPYYTGVMSISYNPNSQLYTMVGNTERYATSSDGVNWTYREFEDWRVHLQCIIYNPILEKTFAVGSLSGVSGVVGYSTDGIDFTFIEVQTIDVASLEAVACNTQNGMMIACNRRSVYTSTDGTTWDSEQITEDYVALCSIAYSDILDGFVCGGGKGSLFTYSNEEWEQTYSGLGGGVNSLFYSEEKRQFVALGDLRYLYTSEDGINNWTKIDTGRSTYFYKMLYDGTNRRYLVVANDGVYYSSGNFSSWSKASNGGNQDIIYSQVINKYVSIATNSIKISLNGASYWSSYNLTGDWRCLCDDVEHSRIIVCGLTRTNQIATSSDGTTWTYVQTNLGSEYVSDLIYDSVHKLYIANVGYRTIKVSKDLSTWTTVFTHPSSDPNLHFSKLRILNGLVYVLGSLIATSIDGINWKVVLPYCINGNDMIFRDGIYHLAGNSFIGYSSYERADNLINLLTQDSDIAFNLQVGENQLRLARQDGNVSCYVRFRQKYIGV